MNNVKKFTAIPWGASDEEIANVMLQNLNQVPDVEMASNDPILDGFDWNKATKANVVSKICMYYDEMTTVEPFWMSLEMSQEHTLVGFYKSPYDHKIYRVEVK